MSRVLVVPDIHAPVNHPAALAFCRHLQEKHKCNRVVFIGDVVDHHAVSFHSRNPECPGAKDEYDLALACVSKWNKAFPKAEVCIGNHDCRIFRLSESVNIPSFYLRDYQDVWKTPKWTWGTDFTIDDVHYFHGTGCGGMHPAFNAMKKMLMSTVMGHVHSAAGIKWTANPTRRIFGMDTGCLIDDREAAFAYGQQFKTRSVLSACVVLDGIPIHEIMPCGPGEKFNRRRFERKVTRP